MEELLVAILIAEVAAPAAFKRGWSCGKRSDAATADGDYFPPRPQGALCSAKQNSRRPPSFPELRPLRCAPVLPCRLGRP